MSYTPPFSTRATVTIRRLAWSLKLPMTSTVERVVNLLPSVIDPEIVCGKCQDSSKCLDCAFSNPRIVNKNFQDFLSLI